ncbi:MAG: hypothetical protein JWQ85_2787 [Mucilaginibacter sp.]|jgi:hypothetical protein|nr:hypothetical protein [Mucilaginibacter sp.]
MKPFSNEGLFYDKQGAIYATIFIMFDADCSILMK